MAQSLGQRYSSILETCLYLTDSERTIFENCMKDAYTVYLKEDENGEASTDAPAADNAGSEGGEGGAADAEKVKTMKERLQKAWEIVSTAIVNFFKTIWGKLVEFGKAIKSGVQKFAGGVVSTFDFKGKRDKYDGKMKFKGKKPTGKFASLDEHEIDAIEDEAVREVEAAVEAKDENKIVEVLKNAKAKINEIVSKAYAAIGKKEEEAVEESIMFKNDNDDEETVVVYSDVEEAVNVIKVDGEIIKAIEQNEKSIKNRFENAKSKCLEGAKKLISKLDHVKDNVAEAKIIQAGADGLTKLGKWISDKVGRAATAIAGACANAVASAKQLLTSVMAYCKGENKEEGEVAAAAETANLLESIREASNIYRDELLFYLL